MRCQRLVIEVHLLISADVNFVKKIYIWSIKIWNFTFNSGAAKSKLFCAVKEFFTHVMHVHPLWYKRLVSDSVVTDWQQVTSPVAIVAYYRNCCTDSNQIWHNDRPPNTLHGWSKQAYNKSKVADGRRLE